MFKCIFRVHKILNVVLILQYKDNTFLFNFQMCCQNNNYYFTFKISIAFLIPATSASSQES